MRWLLFLGFFPVLLISVDGEASQAIPKKNPSAVIGVAELFTSQGCSSCPPADMFLTDLARAPGMIAVSCHVTYWDRLGAPDKLGRDFCDTRQRAYSEAIGSKKIYTPQIIINGAMEMTGSHKDKIINALQKDHNSSIQKIEILRLGAGSVQISLPQVAQTGDYRVWLLGVKKQTITKIQKGENSGHEIVYTHVILSEQNLGSWAGEARNMVLSAPNTKDIDALAVIAQKTPQDRIVAAGFSDLKP